MKKLTTFILPILFLFTVCIQAVQAQTCTGASKYKTSNTTAFSTRIAWSAGGAIETLHYRPLGETTWQEFRGATTPFNLSGLKEATIYEYKITTDCPTYTGTPQVSKFTTIESCNPATNVIASDLKVNSAQLDWTRGKGIKSEIIVYKETGSNQSTRIVTPFGPPSYRLGNLKKDTEYELYIESDCPINSNPTNNLGTVRSPEIRFRTASAASCNDVGFTLKSNSPYEIVASWYPDIANVKGFEICYRLVNSGDDYTCKQLPNTANFYAISSSKPLTAYEVIFKTTCSDGTIYESKETAVSGDVCGYVNNFSISDVSTPVGALNRRDFSLRWNYVETSSKIVKVRVEGSYSPFSPCACTLERAPGLLGGLRATMSDGYTLIFKITTTCENGTSNITYYEIPSSSVPIPTPVSISSLRNNTNTVAAQHLKKEKEQLFDITLSPDLAIKDISQAHKNINRMAVSPNPAYDYIHINLDNDNYKSLTINAIDGRLIKQITIDGQNTVQKIDCSDLPKGLYFITAKGDGLLATEKFVKQ